MTIYKFAYLKETYLKLGIIEIITAGLISSLVEHFGADDSKLQDGNTLVQAMLVPAMLLDVTERSNVVTGHAEHGLWALDRPE